MTSLWSMSTTVRESDRIYGFLKVAKLLEGEVWNYDTQAKFQILLVQHREYLNDSNNAQTFHKLDEEQKEWLINKNLDMPFEMAESIINSKNYVGGPEMRGRQSMNPLRKLGLVYLDRDNKVVVSDVGNKFINDEITYEEFFLDSLLKMQYPNPLDDSYPEWNTKPFLSIMHLIREVNYRCEANGWPARGLTKDEFGIFALTLKEHSDIQVYSDRVIEYRIAYNSLETHEEKELFRTNYINDFLADFKNPVENSREYTDNMIRYLRQTKLISFRGKYSNTYIDLEPRRITEINSILDNDSAAPISFNNEEEWLEYFSVYGTYDLPYETTTKLTYILETINNENMIIAEENNVDYNSYWQESANKEILKSMIGFARDERTRLQNIQLKNEYFDIEKIDETISILNIINGRDRNGVLQNRPSLELEKWSNIALNIINDAILIKPNTIVGDDNEPIHTAPAGVADIECYYESFNSICEVTTLRSRDQWINEGQPVMRHLRNFEDASDKENNYCIFIAPALHRDTINTFWTSVKHEYEGIKQKIMPITINQLIQLLEGIKRVHRQNENLKHMKFKELLDEATNVTNINSSLDWVPNIQLAIQTWVESINS